MTGYLCGSGCGCGCGCVCVCVWLSLSIERGCQRTYAVVCTRVAVGVLDFEAGAHNGERDPSRVYPTVCVVTVVRTRLLM